MICLEAKSVDDFVWLVREFFGVENPCRKFTLNYTPFAHYHVGKTIRQTGNFCPAMIAQGADYKVSYEGDFEVTPQLLSDLAAGGVIFASTRAELEACGVVCHKDQR